MRVGSLSTLLITVLTASSVGSVAWSQENQTLDVGLALRLNDEFNSTAKALIMGIDLAKEMFQAQYPFTRVVYHNYSITEDLSSSIAASDKIIKDKIPAVLGGEYSEDSLVLGKKLGDKKIVFVTPTSSNPRVTEGRPFVYRICFSDKTVADKLAIYSVKNMKPTAIGVIHNVSSPYSDYASKRFIEGVSENQKGKTENFPVYDEKILGEAHDFSKQIKLFKEKKVSHVVLLDHDSVFFDFVTQASAQGYFPVYLGSDGWGPNEKVFDNMVTASQYGNNFKAHRTYYWKEDSDSPTATLFRVAFQKKYKLKPNAWSGIGFDTAWVLLTAMMNAKDPHKGSEIKAEMTKIKKMPTVTSDAFSFDKNNDPNTNLPLYKIDKAGVKYEETL